MVLTLIPHSFPMWFTVLNTSGHINGQSYRGSFPSEGELTKSKDPMPLFPWGARCYSFPNPRRTLSPGEAWLTPSVIGYF